jgi:hypothetical protein
MRIRAFDVSGVDRLRRSYGLYSQICLLWRANYGQLDDGVGWLGMESDTIMGKCIEDEQMKPNEL